MPKKKGKIARTSDPRAGSSRGGKGRELLNQFWQGNGGSRRWTSTKETVREKREGRALFLFSIDASCSSKNTLSILLQSVLSLLDISL